MKVNKIVLGLALGLFSTVTPLTGSKITQAGTIWKQANNPANFVSVDSFKEAKKNGLKLNHPYQFDPKKLTDMLLSLRYNKGVLLLKDKEDQQIFFDQDLLENKLVPKLVEAFQKANSEEAVTFSIVQKDPYFIVRNDTLNQVRAFVTEEGLHLEFLKLNGKLTGDYQSHTTGKKLIDSAKGLKVRFEIQGGQKLALNNPEEIILAIDHDFAKQVDQKTEEAQQKKEDKKSRKRSDSPSTVVSKEKPVSSPPVKDHTERLKSLKEMKEKGLITPQEYETKKKEILKEI